MKLVQTAIADEEYQLLRHRAMKEGKSMKEVARDALRAHLLPDAVNPRDPIFHAFPLIRKRGKTTWSSRNHDELLYSRRP
jgi:plasmid stability protein